MFGTRTDAENVFRVVAESPTRQQERRTDRGQHQRPEQQQERKQQPQTPQPESPSAPPLPPQRPSGVTSWLNGATVQVIQLRPWQRLPQLRITAARRFSHTEHCCFSCESKLKLRTVGQFGIRTCAGSALSWWPILATTHRTVLVLQCFWVLVAAVVCSRNGCVRGSLTCLSAPSVCESCLLPTAAIGRVKISTTLPVAAGTELTVFVAQACTAATLVCWKRTPSNT